MGVWIETDFLMTFCKSSRVTPCMGVWIETRIKHRQIADRYKSHPVWVCGLKLQTLLLSHLTLLVTPCMGVWIETKLFRTFADVEIVTPCMGVWIETRIKHRQIADRYKSHPVWVCGLKHK